MAGVLVNEYGYEVYSPVYGVTAMLLSAIFFKICNFFVVRRGPPDSVDKSVHGKWNNLLVSWIHATIISVWQIYGMIVYPGQFRDPIHFQNQCLYLMVAATTGYFIYDAFDLASNDQFFSSWEIMIHHAVVILWFSSNILMNQCLAYTTIALMTEINSVFLHARKLLQYYKTPFTNPLYRTICYLNLISFVLCRFLALILVIVGLIYLSDQVAPFYYYGVSLSMVIMVGINIVLFWRLFKSDVLRSWSTEGKTAVNSTNNHNSYVHNHRSSQNNNVSGKNEHEKSS